MKKLNLLQTVLLLFVVLMSGNVIGQTPNMYFSNGNVGIGYATPKASLVVTKGTGEWGTALFEGSVNSSHFNWGAGEDWYIRGGKSGSNIIINDYPGAGNVGIGTYPSENIKLQVYSPLSVSQPILKMVDSNTGYNMMFALNNGQGSSSYLAQNGDAIFYTRCRNGLVIALDPGDGGCGPKGMRIDSDGNVAIGHSSPE